MIYHVTSEEEFNEAVSSHPLVLVDFFATWCGPCQMLSPVLEEIDANNETDAVIVKVDTDLDGNGPVCAKYNIRSIPTLILFKDGESVRSHLGFVPKDQVLDFIKG